MIKIILDMELVYPYSDSLTVLIDFCAIWDSALLFGGTYLAKAQISMPLTYFKKIFHENPQLKEYSIPSGMEKFVSKIRVSKIIAA